MPDSASPEEDAPSYSSFPPSLPRYKLEIISMESHEGCGDGTPKRVGFIYHGPCISTLSPHHQGLSVSQSMVQIRVYPGSHLSPFSQALVFPHHPLFVLDHVERLVKG